MFAIIKTGGKQYKVSPKDKIKVEKLEVPENGDVVFNEVLLVSDEDNLKIGEPFVKGAEVIAKVLRQDKAKKVIAFKYKAKKRFKKKIGHRQLFTEVEIKEIK